eukprot:3058210-Amphidinium_carterae.1
MRHAEEFRSRRASPLQRRWTGHCCSGILVKLRACHALARSDYAKWTFREFNELPHLFKA